MKITCKECKQTCCDNMTIILREGQKALNPVKLKRGDWLYVAGITFVKKANGLWKCRAFDSTTRLCKIYPYRPPLCRGFQCEYAKKKAVKLPQNYIPDTTYKLVFCYKNKRN